MTLRGLAGCGTARLGQAWHGKVWHGKVWQGEAWQGKGIGRTAYIGVRVLNAHGTTRRGVARLGFQQIHSHTVANTEWGTPWTSG